MNEEQPSFQREGEKAQSCSSNQLGSWTDRTSIKRNYKKFQMPIQMTHAQF